MGCAGLWGGWDVRMDPRSTSVGQALLPGDILGFPVGSFLGDLSLAREEQCLILAAVSRDVSSSTILCCPAPGQVRTAG